MPNRTEIGPTDIFLGLAVIGLAGFVYSSTLSFPSLPDGTPGPALFPQILSALMLIFGGLQLVQGLRKAKGSARRYEPRALVQAALVLASVGFYIVLLPRLGFLATSFLLLLGLMLLLGVRPVLAAAAALAVASGSALLLGWILRVPLPPGPLGW